MTKQEKENRYRAAAFKAAGKADHTVPKSSTARVCQNCVHHTFQRDLTGLAPMLHRCNRTGLSLGATLYHHPATFCDDFTLKESDKP